MRLKGKRTWSQHQFAVKLRIDPGERHGLFNWERRHVLIHVAKTAMDAVLCWWLALRPGLQDGYLGSISSTFSQAEILRAYALQLHLKQIARLLRASRVETDRAARVAVE